RSGAAAAASLQALLGQLERARHGPALGEYLIVLGSGHTVGDDAGAGLIAVLVASEDQRADGDRMIHVAARAEVPDRAAVEAAADRLQLIDDLHGPHLRGTDERACRECRGEQVEGITLWCQESVDAAHHVHDVAVALDRAIRIDADAARERDAPEIIAGK